MQNFKVLFKLSRQKGRTLILYSCEVEKRKTVLSQVPKIVKEMNTENVGMILTSQENIGTFTKL